MDRQLRAEIVAEVGKITREAYEVYNEEWVSAKTLGQKFEMFTAGWMKQYASTLPRTQQIVVGKDGKEHSGPWNYPVHKIARMIADGSIKQLKM